MNDALLRYDACTLTFVAGLVFVVVQRIESYFPRYRQAMWRSGIAGGLAVAIYLYFDCRPETSGELFVLAIVAIMAGNIAALIAVVIVPPFVAAYGRFSSWRSYSKMLQDQEQEKRRVAERERVRRVAEERERPLRAQLESEAKLQARTNAVESWQRVTARSECLLFFHLHAPELAPRFSRSEFDEYVNSFLRDDMPLEEVEWHAEKLIRLMQNQLEKSGAVTRELTLIDLAKWFDETKVAIERDCSDERMRRTNIARLRQRYDELVQEHFEEFKP